MEVVSRPRSSLWCWWCRSPSRRHRRRRPQAEQPEQTERHRSHGDGTRQNLIRSSLPRRSRMRASRIADMTYRRWGRGDLSAGPEAARVGPLASAHAWACTSHRQFGPPSPGPWSRPRSWPRSSGSTTCGSATTWSSQGPVLPVAVPVRPADRLAFAAATTSAVGLGTSVLSGRSTRARWPWLHPGIARQHEPGPAHRGRRHRVVGGRVRGAARPSTTAVLASTRSSTCSARPGATIPPRTTAGSTRSATCGFRRSRRTTYPSGWVEERRRLRAGDHQSRRLPRRRRRSGGRQGAGRAAPRLASRRRIHDLAARALGRQHHGPNEIRAQFQAYGTAGVQHVVIAPERGYADSWLAGMRTLASVLDLPAVVRAAR